MITITYDEKNITMQVTGHAGYAPTGHDIVCAGVSVLTQTLLANLMKFRDHGWYVLDYDYDTPGEIYIHCRVNGYFSLVVEMFRFTMTGIRMLAEEYPRHITIIEEGEHGTV